VGHPIGNEIAVPSGAGHVAASAMTSLSIVNEASHVEDVVLCEEVDAAADNVTDGSFAGFCRAGLF